MTLLPLLHDRLGYDGLYAQSVIVALCGVAVEAVVLVLYLALSGDWPNAGMGRSQLFFFAAAGAWFLVTASLGYGLAFALCQGLDLRPWLVRVVALLAAPLGSVVAAVVLNGLLIDYGPSAMEAFIIATLASYAVLGLPLVAAAILAALKINKNRVNAEAVFGGTP